MAAPAIIPAIAPPERPLFDTAAECGCGVGVEEETGDVDGGIVPMRDDGVGVFRGCVLAEKASDKVEEVAEDESAEEEDDVIEEEGREPLEEWIADVARMGVA